jgi:hypothetical protein
MPFTLLKPDGIDLSQTFAFTGSVTGAGGGKVLQVINKTDATYQATSGSSFADTSLQQAITPSSTSSKILIIVEQKAVKASGNTGVKMRLNRGLNEANVLNQFQTIGGETEINWLEGTTPISKADIKAEMERLQTIEDNA